MPAQKMRPILSANTGLEMNSVACAVNMASPLGTISKKLTVMAGWYSKSAHERITQAGGTAQDIKGETFVFPKPKKKFVKRVAPKKVEAAPEEGAAPAVAEKPAKKPRPAPEAPPAEAEKPAEG